YWYAVVDTTGLTDITVSSEQIFGQQLERTFVLEYSVDGGPWRNANSEPIMVTGGTFGINGVVNHVLPETAEGVSNLRIRWRLEGTATGNSAIRNIVIQGTGPEDLANATGASPASMFLFEDEPDFGFEEEPDFGFEEETPFVPEEELAYMPEDEPDFVFEDEPEEENFED
ncbi:MAG: hypothetical protein FWF80_02990, partial [Defluviitaleaceae bacterium]|nr:hypothetical protein [Defluviitaleaceae bacterium]